MIKNNKIYTIRWLVDNIALIDFPDYQREPNVWDLWKKQRLIDSILRKFDIASIYFYKKKDNTYDCIDGRQRVNAILSFLGENDREGQHNGFSLKIMNEICEDTTQLEKLNNLTFTNMPVKFQKSVWEYQVNVVEIDKVDDEGELNLLFLRLQLGSILNAGEKLNAMTGYMRDVIFNTIGKHAFFKEIKIPYRRFAREQVAAQIALNYFTVNQFHTARYFDLQEFFKKHSGFNRNDEKLVSDLVAIFDKTVKYFGGKLKLIANRAIAVSVFLFVVELIENGQEKKIKSFVEFFEKFMKTLKWQIPKTVEMDREYHELLKFQTNVTQAAVEKYSIQNRHDFWKKYFAYYEKENRIIGDKEYQKKHHKNPDTERNKVKS